MRIKALIIVSILALGLQAVAQEVRIKDITRIQGMRDNQLTGLGLVTGLDGTGDSTTASRQAVVNLLRKENLNVTLGDVASGNVALVLICATLPPFVRNGDRIDVTVTSIGDAESLFGGQLVQTPLKDPMGDTYAVAMGSLSIGGFSAGGAAASLTKNHLTVGTVPDGAIIEKEVEEMKIIDKRKNTMVLSLRNPDFTTAARISEAINKLHRSSAKALNMNSVEVKVPKGFVDEDLVGFVAGLQALTVRPDTTSKVIISERTGTIVAGADVRISTVAITHGNLIINIAENEEVSQPMPFSDGETTTVDRTSLDVVEEMANFTVIPGNASVADLAQALNAIGATPRDLVVIFQLIKKAGALHAELDLL